MTLSRPKGESNGEHQADLPPGGVLSPRPGKPINWLQVFKRAHTTLLGAGGGPEQRTRRVPSEKCGVGWGGDNDEMRMITVSFARAIERFAGDLCLHFLP